MIFYDFEVFKHDWLVVTYEPNKGEKVIVNDAQELTSFYEMHKDDIWIGFNNRHYDQYILKAILIGLDPKYVNDQIIVEGKMGWQISGEFTRIPMVNYDTMDRNDRGLKYFEGSLGHSIEESNVSFNLDRKLTKEELTEVITYCEHDVEQTMQVFMEKKADFFAQLELVKMYKLPMSMMNKTKVQLSARILEAVKSEYHDEFNIDFPDTLRLKKYKHILNWYKNPVNYSYDQSLDVNVAGVIHSFGWGGVHGARNNYIGTGYFINMDVGSLYPTLMCRYNLMSRSVDADGFQRFKDILKYRLELKHQGKKKEQAPLKIVLNGTYGAMKDQYNPLYDPLQANRVCVYGQLLLLDLIEHLEDHCQIIQSNTDGVLVKLPENSDKQFEIIDDIAYEWERRTGLTLEFDEYSKVIQKDVNNYIIVSPEGKIKTKGAYVKELSSLDYDLWIVNKAVIDFLVSNIAIEDTINSCNDLRCFQFVKKASSKYEAVFHGDERLHIKCVRCFASKNESDGGLFQLKKSTKVMEQMSETPEHSRLVNTEIIGLPVPQWLDRDWYISMAHKRANAFIGGEDDIALYDEI